MEERFLIYGDTAEEGRVLRSKLEENFPHAKISLVPDLLALSAAVTEGTFDVALLSQRQLGAEMVAIVTTLRLRDEDPLMLLVVPPDNAEVVAQAYTLGVTRCIVCAGNWQDEVPGAVRHLLRLRKLEIENRKLVAKLTEANALLEDKNRRLDEFSATLAHDIRGPLGGVSMKLEFMLERYDEKLDDRFKQLMTRALQTTERLTSLVQGMYDYARLGAKSAQMEPIALGDIIDGVLADLNVAPERDVKVTVDELPAVWGSKQLLLRAFSNLVSNAIKYNDKQQVLIRIGCTGIKDRNLGKFAEIFVDDNGPGIAPEDQARLFSMFSRGTNLSVEGLGIGLAVVKRVAELHYGTVSLVSTPGRGCRFLVQLPLEQINFSRAMQADNTAISGDSNPASLNM